MTNEQAKAIRLTEAQQKTIRFAADALEGLDYEDTAGDLRDILTESATAAPIAAGVVPEDLSDAQKQTVECMDSWAIAQSLPSYSQLYSLPEQYSDMLRKICFEYSAGGYNSEGLMLPAVADAKIRWVISDVGRAVAPAHPVAGAAVAEGVAKNSGRFDVQSIDDAEFRKLCDAYHCASQDELEAAYEAIYQHVDEAFSDLAHAWQDAAKASPQPQQGACTAVEQMLETNTLDELGQEVARLQTALCFWLPSVTDREDEVAEHILQDAFLLCGIDGNIPDDFKTAQELGWVTLATSPSPAVDAPADEAQGAVVAWLHGETGNAISAKALAEQPDWVRDLWREKGAKPLGLINHAQPTAEEAPDAAMLLEVIRTVRNHPEFDDEEAPFTIMLDEALAGKRPALLGAIDSLANGRRPTVEEVTNEPFYWLEAEESARGSDPRDVFGKHSMLYSTRMSKDKPIGSNPCWPLYLHPAPKVSRTDHLQKIIAYAYQIAGAHDAPEHILDVLADPEAATDEQVEAMLPYVPQPDRSRPSGNAGEGAAGEFKALWNNCDCHPATCACDAWAVYAPNGKRHSTYGSKVAAEEMAVLLSPKSAAPAFNQSEFDTMVEKGAKAWDGVPGDFVEELRGGADKQQAAIPALESEQNQALSVETWQSDQQQQAGAEHAKRAQIEADQRARMKARFADRQTSPATADFDLPAPNDAVPIPEHAKRAEPDERALFEAYVTSSQSPFIAGAEWASIDIKKAWLVWQARAALQQQAGVPEGWQVVPKEPTEAMVHAAEDVPTPRPFGKVYRAMIAAAPTLGGARDD